MTDNLQIDCNFNTVIR